MILNYNCTNLLFMAINIRLPTAELDYPIAKMMFKVIRISNA